MKAPSNRLTDLVVYVPEVVQILQTIRAGELVQVGK
jgi:hypothetical protein